MTRLEEGALTGSTATGAWTRKSLLQDGGFLTERQDSAGLHRLQNLHQLAAHELVAAHDIARRQRVVVALDA